jgi:AAA15 family ATPase/GTPase
MQTVTIKNFGPIKEIIDLPINNFMVFIGPQASGKSTIAKVIYFFKWLREDIFNQIASDKDLEKAEGIKSYYSDNYCVKIIKKSFFNYYKNYNLQSCFVEYQFNKRHWIKIDTDTVGKETITVSQELEDVINDVKNLMREYYAKTLAKSLPSSEKNRLTEQILIQETYHKIADIFDGVFGNLQNSSYTPASRSFLSYAQPNSRDLDIPSSIYFNKVTDSKIRFGRGIQQYLDMAGWYPKNIISEAQKLIGNVLGGDYQYDSSDNSEKIVLKNGQRINLKLASSGQQEAIWIMLLTLEKLISKSVGFSAVEEPEAHLYPEAQRDIVQLIALLANQESNQVLLTTHSPYILSAINNLMYAYQIGQTKPTETAKLVSKSLWLEPKRVSAFFVANGKIKSIIDNDLKLIKVESIDSASTIINKEYDDLLNLELQQ